jgi:glycosidase
MSERGATFAGLKLANAFVLTTRGVPQLYYGDEIGMSGADEPTTRADFPGGFPGDTRDAFSAAGRSKEQQVLFDYVSRLAHLHTELEPLKRGTLVNLSVSGQQYAYARTLPGSSVIIVLNNEPKQAEVSFDVSRLGLANNAILQDRLSVSKDVVVTNGNLRVSLPQRSAAIFVRK